VPFNDLDAVERAVNPNTAAVLVEGVQGEGGITPATPEFLGGLRKLCDDRGILLMMDGVQCGHFRTGRFQSYETIMGADASFRPDACSMAKSLGGGFPIGAFWCAPKYADALSAGSHGTTYGGNPLACAVANAVLDVVERDGLDAHVRDVGQRLFAGLEAIKARHPQKVKDVRGLGFMVGLVLHDGAAGVNAETGDTLAPAGKLVPDLHDLGMLTVPAGTNVVRLLPALNTSWEELEEALQILERGVAEL
jgi:acetylornithine aminotransferase/acetylornithine/N-succinyldiaminopimelate aminotransferase